MTSTAPMPLSAASLPLALVGALVLEITAPSPARQLASPPGAARGTAHSLRLAR